MTDKPFDADRKGSGTAEWAEVTENICRGCPNNCLYCYAANNANRFDQRAREDWAREEFTKRAYVRWYPARDGVVMFPSSHDITPFNVDTYIRVAKLILQSGNKLLIVSKPRMDCTLKVLAAFVPWRTQVLLRFTIGSVDFLTCSYWEPGAPSPLERIECLRTAFERGYRTSVSIEPMLQGTEEAIDVVDAVRPYITDTIWIGKMNKLRTRVAWKHAEAIAAIERRQSDVNILRLYHHYRNDPVIRWKDSIKEVVAKHGGTP